MSPEELQTQIAETQAKHLQALDRAIEAAERKIGWQPGVSRKDLERLIRSAFPGGKGAIETAIGKLVANGVQWVCCLNDKQEQFFPAGTPNSRHLLFQSSASDRSRHALKVYHVADLPSLLAEPTPPIVLKRSAKSLLQGRPVNLPPIPAPQRRQDSPETRRSAAPPQAQPTAKRPKPKPAPKQAKQSAAKQPKRQPKEVAKPIPQPVAELPLPSAPVKFSGWITSIDTAKGLILQVLTTVPLTRYEMSDSIERYTHKNYTHARLPTQVLQSALSELVSSGEVVRRRSNSRDRYIRAHSSKVKNA